MLEREEDNHEWNEDAYETPQRPQLGRQNTTATGTAPVSQIPPVPPFIPSEHLEESQQHELGRGLSTDSKTRTANPQRQSPSVPSAVPMEKLPSYRESDEAIPRRATRERSVLDSDVEEDEYGDGSGVLEAIAAGAGSVLPLAARREGTLESQVSRRSAGTREGRKTRGVAIPPPQPSLETHTHPRTSSAGAPIPHPILTRAKGPKQAVERDLVPLPTPNSEEGALQKQSRQATTHSLEGQAPPEEPLTEALRTLGQSSEDKGHSKTMKPEAKSSTLPLPPPPPPRPSTINSGFQRPPPPPPPPPPSASFVRPPPPPPLPSNRTTNDIESPRPHVAGRDTTLVNLVPPSPKRSPSQLSTEGLTDSPGPFGSETPLLKSPGSSSSNVSLLRNEGLRNVLGSNDPAITRQSPSPASRSPSRSPGSASWDGGFREGGARVRSGGALLSFESPSPGSSGLLLSPVPSPRPGHSKSMSTQELVRTSAVRIEGGLSTTSMEPLAFRESPGDDDGEARLNRALDAVLQRKKGGGSVGSGGA